VVEPAGYGPAYQGGQYPAVSPVSSGSSAQAAEQLAGAGDAGAASLASDPVAAQRVEQMIHKADSLLGSAYILGGGHGGWGPQQGYDCSGFVSAVLHAGGYLSQPCVTTDLPGQAGIAAGPGHFVTIYDRALPGEDGHVIIEINGQFYESGGMHGSWGGGGGVEKIGQPSASYLSTFPNVLHPVGL
jgi:hypothetical protein